MYFQEAKPVRIKRVHFVNIAPIAETSLNFIKHFFPQKYKNRVSSISQYYIHCSYSIL